VDSALQCSDVDLGIDSNKTTDWHVGCRIFGLDLAALKGFGPTKNAIPWLSILLPSGTLGID
jgi:hypothetical protein